MDQSSALHREWDVFRSTSFLFPVPLLTVCTPHISLDRNSTRSLPSPPVSTPLPEHTPCSHSPLKRGRPWEFSTYFQSTTVSLHPCRGSTTAQNRRPWTKWSTFTRGSLQATSGFLLTLGTPSSPFNLVHSSISPTQADHALCRSPSVYPYLLCPHESRISALTSLWVLPKRRRNF